MLEHGGPLSKACRCAYRAFHRRFQKGMKKYVVRREESLSGKEGMYCFDATTPRTDVDGKSVFALENVRVKVPLSRDAVNEGAFVVDENGDTFVCLRVPARRAQEVSRFHGRWRKTLGDALESKPDNQRGATRGGSSKKLVAFGWRKNPKGKEIGEYAFKTNTSEELAAEVTDGIKKIVECLEKTAHKFVNPADLERLINLKEKYNIPGISDKSVCTQFSVGLDYWAKMHEDDDYFWSVTSTIAMGDESMEKPIHWFVFPEYNVAVPLCSGDILVFNPLLLHGCTNPTFQGSLIFSTYVSSKTVATCTAGHENKT